MGVDLVGRANEIWQFSWYRWGRLLNLALRYGWIPAGTRPNEDFIRSALASGQETARLSDEVAKEVEGWGGHYYLNACQTVTEEDARSLACSLERALSDIPDHDALAGKQLDRDPFNLPPDANLDKAIPERIAEYWAFCPEPGDTNWQKHDPYGISPLEVFSGPRKEWVRGFIEFCRAGEFCLQ
jgi:hypothetical protein